METVVLKTYIHAPIERVWEMVSDHEGYTQFRVVTFAKLLKEGQNERNGLGAVREIHLLGTKFVEEIIAFEPPRRLDYKVIRCSMPMEHEKGCVDLIPRGEGTEIHWVTRFYIKVPLIGTWLGHRARLQFRDAFYDSLLELKDKLESEISQGA